jgi:hypothetical protein
VALVDLVRAVVEVIVAERLEPTKPFVDPAFLETKAASACSLDLAIWFCILGLIFGSAPDLLSLMNASSGASSQMKIDVFVLFLALTSGITYDWRQS